MILFRRTAILLFFILVSCAAFAQSYRNEWIDHSKTYFKFKIGLFGADPVNIFRHSGLVRIPYSTLQNAGLANTPSEHFQLFRNGEEVPLYITTASGLLGPSDFIEFWGKSNDGKMDIDLYRDTTHHLNNFWSLVSDSASYFLTVNTSGSNKRLVTTANDVAGTTLEADSMFTYTAYRYFKAQINQGFAANAGISLYSSSYDRGETWTSRRVRPNGNSCGGQAQLPQNFPNLFAHLNGPAAKYKINMAGNANNTRRVRINLNNDSLTTVQMDYYNQSRLQGTVPMSKLSSDAANFLFINQSQVGCDEFKISTVEISYSRKFNFGGNNRFEFTLDPSADGRFLKITNFVHGGSAPILYDLTNGKRYVADISVTDTVRVVLAPSTQPYELVLLSTAVTATGVTALTQKNFVNFSTASNQGNYIIITNKSIYSTDNSNPITQYKNYRASSEGGSHNVIVADQEELSDQFAYGVAKHPLSIRNFSRFALANFTVAPKNIFIIGKGVTYAVNDGPGSSVPTETQASNQQLNLVPTWGNPASDNLLVAANNTNATPTIPIGRISVVNTQEVADYLQKVIEYETAQRDTTQTLAKKAWMKNVLQVTGANDETLGTQLDGYMTNYKNIISDTSWGAKVTNYSKTANPSTYTDDIQHFKTLYEEGASLLQYFGHSSATALDFNLDIPENYNNLGKYPMFIVNGCNSGNFFLLESTRLTSKTTVSEKYVLAQQRGAIGFVASTHYGIVNYLDIYTKKIYDAVAKTKYNQSIGEILKEGISQSLQQTGSLDYYSRVHAEQTGYHGDPAIKLNTFAQADYAIEASQIEITPSFISVADDSFSVKTKIYNLGKATTDSVNFKLTRTYPNGNTATVYTKKFPAIKYADSVTVKIPIVGNTEKGTNTITAVIDHTNSLSEISEYNNSASKTFTVSEDEIRPIFPYNYSIITTDSVKLKASTVNPFTASREYLMEMDTTALFNSVSKVTGSVTSIGGLIEYPAMAVTADVTYYWRVSPGGLSTPHWYTYSFVRRAGSEGFQQEHIHQRTDATLDKLNLDSTTRQYSFTNKRNNLFITHSIYPTSGTEDGHFSVSVNGSAFIRSACVGGSIIFNVFDSLTFRPWKNVTGTDYQSGAGGNGSCASNGREWNFEYSTRDSANRRKAMQFMDAIPNGQYVVVRKIYDQGNNDFAPVWAADTARYGSGNSLYHRLKNQNLPIDNFSFPRTFVFIYRKNNNSFTPVSAFSAGLYDRITLSKDIITKDTLGYITSPKFGPAKTWKNVVWSGAGDANDAVSVEVIGVDANNKDSLLYTLNSTQQNFSIASVSATALPYIKLKLKNQDSITATPYQLGMWRVEYDAVPEGAIAPNMHYTPAPDSAGSGISVPSDSIFTSIAFKNVSASNFDSLTIKAVLYDSTYTTAYHFNLPKTKTVIAGDSVHINVQVGIGQFQTGMYNLYIDVNPNVLPEQFHFNNFFYKQVYIKNTYAQECTGGSIFFTSPAAGSTYQWQMSTDSVNFTNITNNGNYSGTNTRTLQLNSLPGTAYGYQYRCVVDGVAGQVYTLKFSNYWNGRVSTAWETAANWNCGTLPDEYSDVYIPSGNVVISSNVRVRSLTLANGVNLTVAPGYTLTILK